MYLEKDKIQRVLMQQCNSYMDISTFAKEQVFINGDGETVGIFAIFKILCKQIFWLPQLQMYESQLFIISLSVKGLV